MHYTVGSRGSALALAQTGEVVSRLTEAYPEHSFEVITISTRGDRILDRPLDEIGSRGVFVQEIEEALLEGRIDFAVHSMKDLPSEQAPGLVLAKAWRREDPRDVLVLRDPAPGPGDRLLKLKKGAVLAAGSRRRTSQLLKIRPDLTILPIRGNVDTRLRKLFAPGPGEPVLDGIVLAAAGLTRLGRADEISAYLPVEQMLPAPAQGVLGMELRKEDAALRQILDGLSDPETELFAGLERGFLKAVGGDCHAAVGAYADRVQGALRLRVMYAGRDGAQPAFAEVREDRDIEKDEGGCSDKTAEALVRAAFDRVQKELSRLSGACGEEGLQ